MPLAFLLDEGVPVSVGSKLTALGHKSVLHKDVLYPSAPDTAVVAMAIQLDAILVAFDRDMRQMKSRYKKIDHAKRLHLMLFACSEPQAARRLDTVGDFIVHEWSYAASKEARTFNIEVGLHSLVTYR